MTAQEFAAARASLGLTQDQLASELNLTPHVIAALETGNARIPKGIAHELSWRAAIARRDAKMKASGLPECTVVAALVKQLDDTPDQLKVMQQIEAHASTCPVCQRREAYGREHVGPPPEMPMPGWIRTIGFLEDLPDRLPPGLRPPKGEGGKGRRAGIWMAAGFSAIAIVVAALGAISRILRDGPGSAWWQQSVGIALAVPLAYFIGFFLAGTVYDFTRRIADRFISYVIRGGLILPAVYGSVGAALPFLDKKFDWSSWPVITVAIAVVGAVGGAMLWIIDKIRGKLPKAAT